MVWEKSKILGLSSPFLGFPCSSGKEGRREGKRKLGFEGFKKIKVWKSFFVYVGLGKL